MKIADRELLLQLEEEPSKAMALLVEQYTGLLWKVASGHLSNPEDIKECVNDTFAEFYYHRDRFDPEKGTLSAYLAAIARKRAISAYRKQASRMGFTGTQSGKKGGLACKEAGMDNYVREESGHAADMAGSYVCLEDIPDSSDEIGRLEERLDLEQAMSALNPEELRTIRMKYYDGMTVQEIADSLNLPYETVKKRHQRSLLKLRRMLLLVLALVLAGVLTACAIRILYHFGIIPGYGVSTSENEQTYLLAEPVQTSADGIEFGLDEVVFLNGNALFRIWVKPQMGWNELMDYENNYQSQSGESYLFSQIGGKNYTPEKSTYHELRDGEEVLLYEYLISDIGLSEEDTLEGELSIVYCGAELPYRVIPAKAEAAEQYASSVTEEGGLLAIPERRDGNLIVAIYPLNIGDYEIVPSLVINYFDDFDPAMEELVTVEAADGTVLKGECIGYHPFGNETFFEWNFGPADPGSYTLRLPFVYQTLAADPVEIPINLETCTLPEETWHLPSCELTVLECSRSGREEYEVGGRSLLEPEGTAVQGGLIQGTEGSEVWGEPIQGAEGSEVWGEPIQGAEGSEVWGEPIQKSQMISKSFWKAVIGCRQEDPERTLVGIPFTARCDRLYDSSFLYNETGLQKKPVDEEQGMIEYEIEVTDESSYDLSTFRLVYQGLTDRMTEKLLYRWNHSFAIPFTVE